MNYGGNGSEETLILFTRKFHSAIFDVLLWISMNNEWV